MSDYERTEPCPRCRDRGKDSAGDNLCVYGDGGKFCHACKYFVPPTSAGDLGEGTARRAPERAGAEGSINHATEWLRADKTASLSSRNISDSTCRKYGVGLGPASELIFVYHYRNAAVAQHIRTPDKHFRWHRDKSLFARSVSELPLYGSQLWSGGGKKIIVTEGEIDALSISTAQKDAWPVVSIPNGASSAVASFKANYEYLCSFEEVIICFDMDDPGQEAAVKAAEVLPPGKAKLMRLPRKDANEMLMHNEKEELLKCMWQAKAHRPDGIVSAKDIDLTKMHEGKSFEVYEYPWESWTKALYGRRSGELVMLTSGSGLGKSTVIREMIKFDLDQGDNVGVLMLEEGVKDTLYDLVTLELNKPVRKILASRKINNSLAKQGKPAIDFGIDDDLTDEELGEAFKKLTNRGNLYLYDHFGSLDSDTLIGKMRYMSQAMGCKKIYLDHISIVVSGLTSGNERKDIDVMMTNLRSFVEETDTNVIAVSHLRKSDGKPYEEGGRITAQDLRGSASIQQLSDCIIAFERNQQHTDPIRANTIGVRSLKDRFGGRTAVIGALQYDASTGRLNEIEWTEDEEGHVIPVGLEQDHVAPFTKEE